MVFYSKHFKELERRLDFPPEAVSLFDNIALKLDSDPEFNKEFNKIRIRYLYPNSGNLGKYVEMVESLAVKYSVNPYSLDMVFLIVCSEWLKKQYHKKSLSDDLYWNTVMDFKYKLCECIDFLGVPGTFVAGWNNGFFVLNRFTLGRFQFEKDRFPVNFITSSGLRIRKGQKCINFHIPSSGISLTDEVRFRSYKMAYGFYKNYLTKDGYLVLKCSSWLLYPEQIHFLNSECNILRFLNDFEIFESGEYERFDDAWRIFGSASNSAPEFWPEDTSLQKAYKNRIVSGNKTGYGCGVIVFDGDKIIK